MCEVEKKECREKIGNQSTENQPIKSISLKKKTCFR